MWLTNDQPHVSPHLTREGTIWLHYPLKLQLGAQCLLPQKKTLVPTPRVTTFEPARAQINTLMT